jgi:transaldolase
MNQLEQLKKITKVVSDTGDIEAIRKYRPVDATTNPTLILKASIMPEYQPLFDSAVSWAKKRYSSREDQIHGAVKKLLVNFGAKILEIIPGVVSTEIDARLSFDTEGSLRQAREIIALYKEVGVSSERILIKVASTWEGMRTAQVLEKEKIHCNMTLMFNLVQAIASVEAGATLISPFVGRIYDWYLKNKPEVVTPESDPGVESVRCIYDYLHHFDYPTIVMGASFRNIGQIRSLAGCDNLTISPNFLEELEKSNDPLPVQLKPEDAKHKKIEKISIDEKTFRWQMNEDAMATDKLADGIRIFSKDLMTLEEKLTKAI